jgi:GIY-YIG catalytic domain-containing protein
MTNSIYRRALEHKSGQIDGFASKYGCTRLVHYESFDYVQRAIGREKELKGWTRAKKTAAGIIAPRVGRTLPTVAQCPQCTSGIAANPLVDKR